MFFRVRELRPSAWAKTSTITFRGQSAFRAGQRNPRLPHHRHHVRRHADELKQTKVTQPAVFLHSVILAKALGVGPDMVAGHSLGEFSALVVAGALSFEDGLRMVSKRALAMQAACEAQPGTMAAILGLADEVVEQACAETDGVVVAAN